MDRLHPVTVREFVKLHWADMVQTTVRAAGFVTRNIDVMGVGGSTLEKRLGFGKGSLFDGWVLLALAEPVEFGEFVWEDTTRFSGGWDTTADPINPKTLIPYSQVPFQGKALFPKRDATMRDHSRVLSPPDMPDDWYDAFTNAQRVFLNDRTTEKRIVKVVPLIAPNAYPDAPASAAVRQWQLLKPKLFVPVALTGRDYMFRGGNTGRSAVNAAVHASK